VDLFMLKFGCLILLVVVIAIPTIVSQFSPWWVVMLVVFAELLLLIYGLPFLIKHGLKRFAIGLFTTKSRALRGAAVQIHEIRNTLKPVERENEDGREEIVAADGTIVTSPQSDPDDDDEDEEDDEVDDSRYVLVDFTLTPIPGSSRMQHYDPFDLMLVPFDTKTGNVDPDDDNDENSASVHMIKRVDDSGIEQEIEDKLIGPARLRITFAVPPTLTGRVKFRHYFESFGDLRIA
jgi:hypothetical protein